MKTIEKLPKISIVTPNYNYGHLLEQTILSVLNQDYPNLEYIIIDGGSTDNSIEIIKKYESQLAYWVSEKDDGMYDAINKGFMKSTGEIMAWLNSDDVYLPWAFETVASVFTSLKEVEWISSLQPGLIDYSSTARWFGSISGFSDKAFIDGKYAGLHGSSEYIQQESTFWRRSLWLKAGGYICTDYKLAGDFELWSRFYQYANLCGVFNPFSLFRYNYAQKSFILNSYLEECRKILNSTTTSLQLTDKLRLFSIQAGLIKVPLMRKILRRYFGYSGNIITRKNRDNPKAEWIIEKKRFL